MTYPNEAKRSEGRLAEIDSEMTKKVVNENSPLFSI